MYFFPPEGAYSQQTIVQSGDAVSGITVVVVFIVSYGTPSEIMFMYELKYALKKYAEAFIMPQTRGDLVITWR